jgi:hypothetical protein
MNTKLQRRNVLMVLAGVAGLLLKGWLSASIGELAYSYAGNLVVSFAVYYLVSIAAGSGLHRAAIAVIALLLVEAFEWTDGFGCMANVVDPFDYVANALGVALAVSVDLVSARLMRADAGTR